MKKILLYTLVLLRTCTPAFGQTNVYIGPSGGDDAPAFESAANMGKGAPINVVPASGTYHFSRMPAIKYSNVTVLADTSTMSFQPTWTSTGGPFIGVYGSQMQSTAVSISVVNGSNTFTWSGASGVTDGDILVLYGPVWTTLPDTKTYSDGWFGRIVSHTSTTVTMDNTPKESYTATKLNRYRPLTNIHLNGMRMNLSAWSAGRGVEMNYVAGCSVENCVITGTPNSTTGITMGIVCNADNILISGNHIRDLCAANTSGTSHYAINPAGVNITVSYNVLYNILDGIENGGRDYFSRGLLYYGNDVRNVATALGVHGDGEAEWAYNVIYAHQTFAAVGMRYFRGHFHHNYVRYDNSANHTMRAIWALENGYLDLTVDSNYFVFDGGTASNNRAFAASSLMGTMQGLKIFGNNFYGCSIQLPSTLGSGIEIHDNNFYTWSGVTGTISTCSGCVLANNKHFTGFTAPTESILGTTPAPPSGGDTSIAVVPTPVDTITCMDCSFDFIQWKSGAAPLLLKRRVATEKQPAAKPRNAKGGKR